MGKWPVTLYSSQWERLLGEAEREFIAAHADELSTKENPVGTSPAPSVADEQEYATA